MARMPKSHLQPAEHEGPSLWPGTPQVCSAGLAGRVPPLSRPHAQLCGASGPAPTAPVVCSLHAVTCLPGPVLVGFLASLTPGPLSGETTHMQSLS